MSVIKGTKTRWKLISLSKHYNNFLYFLVYVSRETRILIKRFVVKLYAEFIKYQIYSHSPLDTYRKYFKRTF